MSSTAVTLTDSTASASTSTSAGASSSTSASSSSATEAATSQAVAAVFSSASQPSSNASGSLAGLGATRTAQTQSSSTSLMAGPLGSDSNEEAGGQSYEAIAASYQADFWRQERANTSASAVRKMRHTYFRLMARDPELIQAGIFPSQYALTKTTDPRLQALIKQALSNEKAANLISSEFRGLGFGSPYQPHRTLIQRAKICDAAFGEKLEKAIKAKIDADIAAERKASASSNQEQNLLLAGMNAYYDSKIPAFVEGYVDMSITDERDGTYSEKGILAFLGTNPSDKEMAFVRQLVATEAAALQYALSPHTGSSSGVTVTSTSSNTSAQETKKST